MSKYITYANFKRQIDTRIKLINDIEISLHKQSPELISEYNELMEKCNESLNIQIENLSQFKEKMNKKAKAKKSTTKAHKQSKTQNNKITVNPSTLTDRQQK